MPWKVSKKDYTQSWPGLAKVEKYLALQAFLQNEKQVRDVLAVLDAETSAITSADGFRTYLATQEASLGFNADVVTVQGIVSADTFLGYVNAKRPIYDIGAGINSKHGALTHRAQWIMIGIFDREARYFADGTDTIADLYKGLASQGARKGTTGALWNDLLDNTRDGAYPDYNGTASQPEYLHSTLVEKDFARLRKIWT